MSIINLHQWSGLCDCGQAKYNNNPHCTSCMANEAKKSRTDERKSEKQQKDLAKALERQREPKQQPKQVSKKQAAINAEKSRIKKRMQEVKNICFTCEEAKGETLSHIITAKNKAFELLPLNLVLECSECHTIWENHKKTYYAMFPQKWHLKLERVKQLSEKHYNQFLNQLEK